jgi:tRNA A37 threonylcarbamoyladenosine dehydratase
MSAGESRVAMTRIGVLGFGEVGSTFAKALADSGCGSWCGA